ncbi:hypothetical protein BDV18DRAFT_89419 [Aspergillus unguis]
MESLPKGLVTISGKVTAELDGIGVDAVDVGDIIQLWKAYSTNPSAHEGDAGYRLQNFFWRIWGSKRLSKSLTGSTLARLFLQISESTSPRPFSHGQSRKSRPTPTFTPGAKGSEPLSSSLKRSEKNPEQHPPNPSPDIGLGPTPAPAHRSSSGASSKPLQPILKKSNSSSHGETQKTTRLLLTGLGGQSVTRKPSNPPTPIPPSRPVALGEQQQQQQGSSTRASQKKSFSVGGKAKASKRRPVLMRRKSSQQSSFSASSTRNHSPESTSPPAVNSGIDAAWLEDEMDEEAIEDSPEDTHPVIPKPRAASTPANTHVPTAPILNPTITTQPPQPTTEPAPAPESQPSPPKTAKERIESQPLPQLPPTFYADIKTLLHKSTPLPPLRPRASPPAVGFFSAQACRHYDVRHLSQENYEQPNRSVLVEQNFRSKFAEQQRLAEEYYRQWWAQYREQYKEQYGHEPDLEQIRARQTLPNENEDNEAEKGKETERPGTGTGTGTEETVSPSKSRFGGSPSHSHIASTMATSILDSSGNNSAQVGQDLDPDLGLGQDTGLDAQGMFLPIGHGQNAHELEISNESGFGSATGPRVGSHSNGMDVNVDVVNTNTNTNTNASSSAMAVPVPTPGPTNPFTQTPGLSAPRGPSGLSLLISASRNSTGVPGQGMEMGMSTSTKDERRSDA